MKQTYFIGLDIGTTSTKAIVFTPSGAVRGVGNVDYPLLVPQPSWAEQDPETIFAAVISALKTAIEKADVDKRAIGGIGFSTAMHSLIAVDHQGSPLTHSIIWADNRSTSQVDQLKQDGVGHSIYLATGTPIHPMSPLPKIMWLREQAPDTFRKAAKFISIKEYVIHRLFGQYVVDYSIASATGLFHLRKLDWDENALQVAGITRQQLSEPVPTTHILRGMKIRYAEEIGLDADTPFVVGASDGVLANLGIGAIDQGQVAITIGTSGAVRTVVPEPITDPKGRTFCYLLTENHWVIGGPSNNGGIMLRWFRDEFSWPEVEKAKQMGVDPYDVMIEAAEHVPAGAEGLLFLPFLSGERAPYWNAQARGSFFGIGLHHKREHFIRAVLEGILFSVYSIGIALRDLAGGATEIRASGGFARSRQWRQIMSDMFGYEVLIPESHESSSYGAALLAMHALGALNDLHDVKNMIHISHRHEPNLERSSTYLQLFYIYERVYYNLLEEYKLISEFQKQLNK
ncbi:gluconokinase [Brevibacillus centrosporus]|uniref:gluconokinase n=1 Tax=Brevibacillus centrosporus TaxID=54910 RepID=UPI000F0A7F79|nr:gluconokinase [Brevibacillus centrosporus]MEC2129861.1 gluconokinase [Brevibacillus centrosporus]MED4907156.1 gluconokinase [Brevibacillus centrosporus]RNB71802.1 gluconate kinase [Brevibacillus centrosporus]GED32032.1 gluconate kinase [Brevibacillus centrosporus]